MKFLIDLWLDGYNTDDEQKEACEAFIEEQLDCSSSSIKILNPEVQAIVESVQFGFDPDITCSECSHDLDLRTSSETVFRPIYCPGCGGRIQWNK